MIELRIARRYLWAARKEAHTAFLSLISMLGLGLTTGDDITVIAPRTRLTPFGPVPVWRKYRIALLLPSAVDGGAPEAMLDMREAERLFGTSGPTSIEMFGNVALADVAQAKL